MTYYAYTPETLKLMWLPTADCNCYEDDFNPGIILSAKRKADILIEGALLAERLGVSELYIKGVTRQTSYKVREGRCIKTVRMDRPTVSILQSWYVYNDSGEWRFKMRKSARTSHPVFS